ncbi:hypothetical protein B0H17DRAFT_1215464 [Mycena rosella]|uniref:Cytochrome P450 n=1 Tax=Mycena rosella TaxID=1033263 RepID=A0AAD7G124_MYCRO|nr:hypothetical protein B0H17DRAFT_1215464 [Mycena rosella]
MSVIRAFLDPFWGQAVARRRGNGGERHLHIKEDTAQDREVQEGETLVDHLLNYTEDRTILRDKILNISVAGRDTTASLLTFAIYMPSGPPEVFAKLRPRAWRMWDRRAYLRRKPSAR